MRTLGAPVLQALVSLLLLALGADGAAALTVIRPCISLERELIVEAVFECGVFDGTFQCRAAPGGRQFGKNALPGSDVEVPRTSPQAVPGTETGQPPTDATACQGGMIGTPPNCQCPESSELLGGHCIHYTATCKNALPADAPPQQCRGVEEKLACKARDDGLKDCCCITYDKF